MVAVQGCGHRYIHMHRRHCTASCLGGGDGRVTALRGVIRQMPTIERMVLISTTLGTVGYLLL